MFNLELYKEGLKKSALLSAILITVMMIEAILAPIRNIMAQTQAMEVGLWFERLIIVGLSGNLDFIAMIIFAPILTLYLFSFLHKNDSNGFFNSIPYKKETIFVSYTAVILTWIFSSIWLCTITTIVIYSFATTYVIVNVTYILLATLGLMINCVLVIGATLIAISVTNSVFTSLVTALVISFLPRIILAAFVMMVVGITRIVSPENFGFIGNIFYDIVYNIPFGFMMSNHSISFSYHIYMDRIFTQGILYTVVLSLIYLGIAFILFKKQSNETTRSLALNRIAHTTVRIGLAFAVCIPALWVIVHGVIGDINFNWIIQYGQVGVISSGFEYILTFYVAAAVVYFAYELITTKKLLNMLKILPGLGILVLLNIVFIAGATFTHNAILDREFEISEIKAVQILSLDEWHLGMLPYESHQTREVKIQDEQLTAFLLEHLAKNIAQIRRTDRIFYFWQSGGIFLNYFEKAEGVFPGHFLTVGPPTMNGMILFETTSGQTIQRNIQLLGDAEARMELLQILARHEEYTTALMSLPENPADLNLRDGNLPKEVLRDIYEILREEVQELDFLTWYGMTRSHSFSCNNNIIGYGLLYVRGFLGGHTYRSWYLISNLTPRTANKLVQHINVQNFEYMEYALEKILAADVPSLWPYSTISVGALNTPYNTNYLIQELGEGYLTIDRALMKEPGGSFIRDNLFGEQDGSLAVKVLLDTIREQQNTPVDLERIHYRISISGFRGTGVHFAQVWTCFFFNSDSDKLFEALQNLSY